MKSTSLSQIKSLSTENVILMHRIVGCINLDSLFWF